MRKALTILFALFCLGIPCRADADASVNVPIDDPVYRDIDKLVAAGLIKDAIYGQRPWSRGETARMVASALKAQEVMGPPHSPNDREVSLRLFVDDILKRLKRDFREELIDREILEGKPGGFRFHPLDQVRLDYTLLDSPNRVVPIENGLGRIDAVINPLVANREGRHFVDGSTLGLETTHRARLSKYFSLYFRPRLEVLAPNTVSSDVNPIVQQLYGKFAYRNFELEAGRDSLIWGQGEFGGLMFSNNARPLDMIKLGNPSPFYHPWIFKYLGPSKYTFFIANLGPEREFSHSFMLGGKGTIKPVSWFEFSTGQLLILGGKGGPPISAGGALLEFWGIRGRANDNVSSRLASVEGRLYLPSPFNIQLYQEFIIDDVLKKSYKNTLEDRVYYLSGIYLPHLLFDNRFNLRIEYKHFPGLAYRHIPFTSGTTLNKQLLGDELGPDSDGVYLSGSFKATETLEIPYRLSYEDRDSDLFTSRSEGGNVIDDFRTTNNLSEHRWRFQGGVLWNLEENLTADINLGYERTNNFNFIPTAATDNFLISLTLAWSP